MPVGINRGQEAAPLVVGDTMFIVTHYPNIVYALDLKKPGHVRWRCARMIALILPTGANLSIVRHRRRLRGASRSRP